jgi:hypothetical protein
MSAFNTNPQSFRSGDALSRAVSAIEEMVQDYAQRRRRRRVERLISGLSEFQREDLGLHELWLARVNKAQGARPAKPAAGDAEALVPYLGGLGRRAPKAAHDAIGPGRPKAGAQDAERLVAYPGGLGRR